jgi:hypothetical protein
MASPPVHVFERVLALREIVIRSIDLGAETRIRTFEELEKFTHVGSEFSLVKATLALAGFHPRFTAHTRAPSLEALLGEFGGGLEISLLDATPKGSGLGTSSILAATLLGTLSEVCGLGWDHEEICSRTLALKQLLTTGGGWQLQTGGNPSRSENDRILDRLHQTRSRVLCSAAPLRPVEHQPQGPSLLHRHHPHRKGHPPRNRARNFSQPPGNNVPPRRNHRPCARFLRYPATRVVRRPLQRREAHMGLNCALDSGTNPPAVHVILNRVSDWTAAAKLPGARGGGYILFLAKDPEAASCIRHELTTRPPHRRARFVRMDISNTGLQVKRS